jgi:hydrogenase/urease accessory protein HupE
MAARRRLVEHQSTGVLPCDARRTPVPIETRKTLLRAVLLSTAVFLVFVLPFMFDLWPGGFRWAHPAEHRVYERMIIAVYFALGICLVPAAFDPERHVIIIDFTVLSSLLHGAVMTYDAFAQQHEMTHMVGDVPLLFALAAILIWLHPRRWPSAAAEASSLARPAGSAVRVTPSGDVR